MERGWGGVGQCQRLREKEGLVPVEFIQDLSLQVSMAGVGCAALLGSFCLNIEKFLGGKISRCCGQCLRCWGHKTQSAGCLRGRPLSTSSEPPE